jgi:chromosomal replication initiation ATPase DnaA
MSAVTFSLQLAGADGAALDHAMIKSLESRGYTVVAPGLGCLTVALIQKRVAAYYKVPVTVMQSDSRKSDAVYPRMVAMYLARELTSCSLAAIGAEFGGRGHDTVSNAVGVVLERAAAYQSANDALSILRNELREAAAKIA